MDKPGSDCTRYDLARNDLHWLQVNRSNTRNNSFHREAFVKFLLVI